jgi:hypothetical protein
MVVALIALFVALGGVSYAAISLPANSVGTRQLKKNAVTATKIKANAVNGSKVAANSLTGAKILESSLGPVPSANEATNAVNATNAANAAHAATADALPALSFTTLTLKNGWVGNCYGGGVPQIAKSSEGVVYFRGELCRNSGTSDNPFALPAGFVPTNEQWLTADQITAATGRIYINPSGEVRMHDDPEHPGSAAGFTSLSGVFYTLP